jgi:hypothetical protein
MIFLLRCISPLWGECSRGAGSAPKAQADADDGSLCGFVEFEFIGKHSYLNERSFGFVTLSSAGAGQGESCPHAATPTASRHVAKAAARSSRFELAEMRWRQVLNVL